MGGNIMKLNQYQLYVNLCIDDSKKPSSGFFRKEKKYIPPTYYCPKCHVALTTMGKCTNDFECDFKK